MPTNEEIENAILDSIADSQKSEHDIIVAYFSWMQDPNSVDDETLLKIIRWKRNGLLFSSDWTQVPDSTVDKQAWVDYRQQLRDLPSQNDNIRLIAFPEPPA